MDTAALERLDAWPYRHRLADIMRSPVVTATATETVAAAAARLRAHSISAVIVVDGDGRAIGIVTERDVLRQAAAGGEALQAPLGDVMSKPVEGLPPEAFVYRALARVERRGYRHCPVLDADGRPVGMISARLLLRQRAQFALALGDSIETAADAAALKSVHDQLPKLARALRADGVAAPQIAALIATVVRDLTGRAAELALAAMRAEGRGGAPADWCVLVLGAGGRGESLLAPDQDNALVHDGDLSADPWFAAFGVKLNAFLDRAGVPLCTGGVMVGNPAFRRSVHGWKDEIDRWANNPAGPSLANVDIFWDFVPVAGDPALARSVRAYATKTARKAPPLLRQLAAAIEGIEAPFDLVGRFRAKGGRLDLKRHGLFPIVAGARVMALAAGIEATATDRRLADVATLGLIDADQARALAVAHADLAAAILDQQLADLYAGQQPGSAVDPKSWSKATRAKIKDALRAASHVYLLVRDVLTGAVD